MSAVISHMDAMGLDMAPGAIRRLVKGFIRTGQTSLEALSVYLLPYSDPTGNTAARNVDRERGARV